MNDYQIVIKEWYTPEEAEKGLNYFIEECNREESLIVDMKSHITGDSFDSAYTFIFKVKRIESKKFSK